MSLPRSLDVNITLSKPQAEQTTDLSIAVFAQAGGGFGFGADRIAFYSTFDAANTDTRVTAEGKKAARDFFSQNPRAKTMAIGQVFSTAQAGFLKTGGATANLAALLAVTTGTFAVAIDGVNSNLTGVNLSAAVNFAGIAAALQTKIRAVATGGFTLATVVWDAVTGTFKITSGTTGDLSSVSVLAPVTPPSGVDISGAGFLNGALGTGIAQPGYLPTGQLVDELTLIAQAARSSGKFIYGWAIDAVYRDGAQQTAAAGWAQARTAFMPLVSNSPLAWDPSSTTDLGPVVRAAGQYRAEPFYHNNPQYYPDMATLAVLLSVNYAQKASTITMKFKDLVGIPIVSLNETQWATLQSKGYNTLTLTGNTSRVFREGTTGNLAWFMDDVVNLDNFTEDLQVAVYNVFLRNKKVPYNSAGVMLLQDAAQQICERYIYNNTFSERRVLDVTQAAGFRIDPPYTITPTPLELMSVADRAARIGPPFVIDVNLAGAIHSIAINVNAYS